MFYDPFRHAFAKRGELASLQTAPLFTLCTCHGYPAKHRNVSSLVANKLNEHAKHK